MISLYVDESGSMDSNRPTRIKYFSICLLRTFDSRRLKSSVKRFVSAHINELKESDSKRNKMFRKSGEFIEIKGSSLSPKLKYEFANYLCKTNKFEVYYITFNNDNIDPKLYKNTARAFNYGINQVVKCAIKNHKLPINDCIFINIDERNNKVESLNSLEDYLSIDLSLNSGVAEDIKVKYFDSCNSSLIQVADFFSNLYYSFLRRKERYSYLIKTLWKRDFIKLSLEFPYNSNPLENPFE